MNNQSIDPKTIAWNANTAKREADRTIYRAMAYDLAQQSRKSGKRLRALTFPAKTWAWELGLTECYPDIRLEFVGLEQDPTIYKATKRFASGFPKTFAMSEKPMPFRSFAEQERRKKPFDIVYLDWMGTWSKEKKNDISAMFHNQMLAVGGLLLITVSLRRGQPRTLEELADLSYDLPLAFYDARGEDKYASNLKVRGIPHWIQDYAINYHDVDMRPIMASVYYSRTGLSTQTQPQLQILMLRES
jgi:hypothetical protein